MSALCYVTWPRVGSRGSFGRAMKGPLFTSSAIVGGALFLGSPVAAGSIELSLSGSIDFQAGFTDQDVDLPDRGYDFRTDSELDFDFRGEADNGLRYGARVALEVDQGSTNNSDEVWTWLEGGWGRVQLGDRDGAESQMAYSGGLTQAGAGGIDGDVDDWLVIAGNAVSSPEIENTNDDTKITYYTPRITGLQFGASFTPQTGSMGQDVANDDPNVNGEEFENHVALGVNFQEDFDDVEVGLSLTGGFADAVNQDNEDFASWAVGGYVEYGGIILGASYGDNGDTRGEADGRVDDDFYYDVGLGYSRGPWEASVGYLHSEFRQGDTDDEFDNIAVSGGYEYGPGLYVYFDLLFVSADSADEKDNDGTVLLFGHVLSF